MSDIFISYASENRAETKKLAHALEIQGWSVWWDHSIPVGKSYEKVIEEALNEAKCVIVIWSEVSVQSDWVLAEVAEAQRQKKLFPLNTDGSNPPLLYRRLQTADFSCWSGDETATVFKGLIKAIHDFIGPPVVRVNTTAEIKEEISQARTKFKQLDSIGNKGVTPIDQNEGKQDENVNSKLAQSYHRAPAVEATNKFESRENLKTNHTLPSKVSEISNVHIESSSSFHLQLITACSSQSVRDLRLIKEHIVDLKKTHRQGKKHLPLIELSHANNLADAIAQAATKPDSCVVLACGYSTLEIRSVLADYNKQLPIVIISHPSELTESLHIPTSSLLEERDITRVKSLEEGVHKLILRYVVRQLGEIRPILEQSEWEQYFALRFKVWNDMGYMASDNALQSEGWEIDHFDRFSLPIGLFSYDGELLACCRLVQQYGCESTQNVRAISRLLKDKNKRVAAETFSYTGRVEQPFDILCEFRGFREYYRSLVHNKSMVAEVSRVIVAPGYRGRGLAEALVDSLVSVAKVQGIDVFMLACRESLSPLYQQCGFVVVPNLVSEKFLSIAEKSIVMERNLK